MLPFSPMADSVTASLIHCGEGCVWGHLKHFNLTGVNGGPSRDLVAAVSGACAAAIVIIIVLTASLLLVAQRRQMQSDLRPGGQGIKWL